MKTRIFIAFTHCVPCEGVAFKKIKHQGKEYQGIYADKEIFSLQEIKMNALSWGQDFHHIILIPVLLFG